MRIIAGKYKGQKLISFQASHIRPTTDRVKESIFNILQGRWDGAEVLDLYSGTGNLSIEALSRGAKSVLSVENHPKSIQILEKNKAHFKIGNEWVIRKQDVFQFLKRSEGKKYDIILIDPPFVKELAHPSMQALGKSDLLHLHGRVVIEAKAQEPLEDLYTQLQSIDSRSYGDKLMKIFALKE